MTRTSVVGSRVFSSRFGHFAVGAIYTILTIALTWPTAVRLTDSVPHDLADPLLSVWVLWWNAYVLPFTARWWEGMAFFPAGDTLTFSDHRVGLGIISTPIIWLTGSPIVAYNAVFFASFAISAIAAYALCFALTKSRQASFIGGLVFGFNPYRADHLPHLELLASYWLPVVFLALHKWAAAPGWKWACVLAIALLMQALTSGYYFVFAGVLIGFWLLWFARPPISITRYAPLAIALAVPLIAVTPILMHYHDAHIAIGLSRSIHEIEYYSADIIGLLSAPELLWLWNSPQEWRQPEGSLFPGLTAVAIVVTAALATRTAEHHESSLWWSRARVSLIVGAAIAAVVALIPLVLGPVSTSLISLTGSYKPFSICVVLLTAWLLTSLRVRNAWRTRSVLGFYVFATLAMWVFALGPTARFFGNRVFYKAPYSWLMLFPGIRDEFRAPARFAMLAVLALAIATAVALYRLLRSRPAAVQWAVTTVVALAVISESWIHPFPVATPPPPLTIPREVPSQAVVLELPSGFNEDAIAMFRSIDHRRRTVNGLSGYAPPHYVVLNEALNEERFEVLQELARYSDVAVFLADDNERLATLLKARANAQHLARTADHDVLLVRQTTGAPDDDVMDHPVVIRALSSNVNVPDLHLMQDGNTRTAWVAPGQEGREEIVADLGFVTHVSGIVHEAWLAEFPRALSVDVRAHEEDVWTEAWRGDTASKSLASVLHGGPMVKIEIRFPSRAARFVRMRQVGHSTREWTVVEFRVLGLGR